MDMLHLLLYPSLFPEDHSATRLPSTGWVFTQGAVLLAVTDHSSLLPPMQGPFDITRKLFSSQEGALTLQDRSNLFFEDYSFVPLFVQENYITARPDNVQWVSRHPTPTVSYCHTT